MIYLTLTVGPGPALTAVAALEETRNVKLTGRELFVRHIRNRPVYRPERRLRVVEVARFPFAGSVAALVNPLSAAVVKLQNRMSDEGRMRLVGECSDYVFGRGVRDILGPLRAVLLGEVYSTAVEVVTSDLPRPTPEGWRVKVPRRDVVSALVRRSGDGTLMLDVRGPLAKELATQLGDMTQKPQRTTDEAAPEEDLALGVALVCYAQENQPRTGYVGDMAYASVSGSPTPERPSEVIGWGQRR